MTIDIVLSDLTGDRLIVKVYKKDDRRGRPGGGGGEEKLS
jgi:hypothetical protein